MARRRAKNRKIQPRDWGRLRRLAEGVLLVAVLAGASVASVLHLRNPATLPIRAVKVEGSFRYLDEQQLQTAVSTHALGGFFTIDLDAIRAEVLQRPWVEEVRVRRLWPDTVVLQVMEHEPLARWRDGGLVSDRGVWFDAPHDANAAALPEFAGPEGFEHSLALQYYRINTFLEPLGMSVATLTLSPRRALRLELDNGLQLRLGRGDHEAALARFVAVYANRLAQLRARMEVVDLRYTNGFAVRWRPPREASGDEASGEAS